MFALRLLLALAVAALAGPLRGEPVPPRPGPGPHPPRLHCRHPPYCRGILLLPPYQPFGVPPQEPFSAQPFEVEPQTPFPPPAPRAAPAAPSASQSMLPQGMMITVRKIVQQGENAGAGPSPLIERPIQAAQQLATCWSPPVPRQGETVEATIRFSFNRRGAVVGGAPRVTFVKPGAGQSAEDVRASILAAVRDCTPLRFSASMAESAPGYPLSIRFIGERAGANQEQK